MLRFSMLRHMAILLLVFIAIFAITMQVSASAQSSSNPTEELKQATNADEESIKVISSADKSDSDDEKEVKVVDSGLKVEDETQEEIKVKSSFDAEAAVEKDGQAEDKTEDQAEEQLSADPRVNLLNAINLNSRSPQSEDLSIYLAGVMSGLLTDDMSTYEKLWVCYDYIADTTSYGSHTSRLSTPIGNTTCRAISKEYGTLEGYGAVVLTSKTGLCNAYSAAFILMANEIGLDAYMVTGYTRSAWGGYIYHEWAEVNIDGTLYVFDPQLDQSLERAGFSEGSMFFKPYTETAGRYSKR